MLCHSFGKESFEKPEKSQADCETVQILLVFAVWGLVLKDISVMRLQKSLCAHLTKNVVCDIIKLYKTCGAFRGVRKGRLLYEG